MNPGIYELPEDEYHADPVPGGSLSSSGARKLLPPDGCPARFHHDRHNPPAPTDSLDHGRAAHQMVLGGGSELAVVDYPNWRTKAARMAAERAREQGQTPILVKDAEIVEAMADALRDHPVAVKLLSSGKAEQTLIWQDQRTDVWCRARLDVLPDTPPFGRRMIIPDYKTCASASPESIRKSMYKYKYYFQAAWYRRGVKALRLDPEPVFVFIFQEKVAPYLVTVAEPDPTALALGNAECERALDLYTQCQATGHWPPYSERVESIPLPGWVQAEIERRGSW